MAALPLSLSAAATARRPCLAAASSSSVGRTSTSGLTARAAGRLSGAAPRRPQQHSQRIAPCRAQDNQEPQRDQPEAASSSSSDGPATPKPRPDDPTVAKGQRTAIVTGAISIVFGMIYLALVFFLDMRGGEMLPPPPEAFGL